MSSLGSLLVSLAVDTAKFQSDLGRATSSASGFARDIRQKMSTVTSAIGSVAPALGGLLSVGGIAEIARQTADYAAQVERLSRLSNTSVEEFQRLAAGARQVGIEQDKLADIFKDAQDKVGDFLQTGGGPLADFFENIAPQIGLTAEEFRTMSGPQVLGAYVSALERAGVSQSEMIFYLEAIASDASLLQPLLENNAEGFRVAGDQAERFGQILDQEAIRAANEFNIQIKELEGSVIGLRNQIGMSLIPTLIELSDEFRAGMMNANGFFDALTTFGTMGPVGDDIGAAIDAQRKELENLLTSQAAYLEVAGKNANERLFVSEIENARQRLGYLETLLEFQRQRADRAEIARERANAPVEPRLAPAPTSPRPSRSSASAARQIDEAQRYLDTLQRQLESMDKLSEVEKLTRDIQLGRLGAVTSAQRAALESVAAEIDARRAATEAAQQQAEHEREIAAAKAEQAREGAQIYEATRTPMEQLNSELGRLQGLLDAGVITWDTYGRAVFAAQDAFEAAGQAAAETASEMDQFARNAAQNIQRSLGDTFVSIMEGNFDNLGQSFTQMLNRMVAEAAAAQLARHLFGGLVEGGSGSGALGGIVQSFASSIFGGRAMGGPVSPHTPYLVGEHGPELFVPATAGSVQSNGSMRGMTVVNNFTVSGPVDKRTQMQIAAAAQQGLARGQRNL